MFRIRPKVAVLVTVIVASVLSLAGCSTPGASATVASCAFIVGNGEDDHDAKLHHIVYPGESVKIDYDDSSNATELAEYVPCNPRNFITNDGTVRNANNKRVGDRFKPTDGYTKTGVPIKIWSTVDWELNESKPALEHFFPWCFKYTCFSSKDVGGKANFATDGWNGWLGENMGPAVDTVALKAKSKIDDSIWKDHDPAQYEALGKEMSANFADAIRAKSGYSQDIFCGSGSSGWTDPKKPGEGTYTCTPVRITIDKVERGAVSATDSSTGVLAINAQRLSNAEALYGSSAKFWLGLQDSIALCSASKAYCSFNVGGNGAPTIPTPTR